MDLGWMFNERSRSTQHPLKIIPKPIENLSKTLWNPSKNHIKTNGFSMAFFKKRVHLYCGSLSSENMMKRGGNRKPQRPPRDRHPDI